MYNKVFEFKGSGFGYLWLVVWTSLLTIITFGLFFPWAYSAQQRWITANTYVHGKQLAFHGTGPGFFVNWLIIMVLTIITFGLYTPWAYCQIKRWETNNITFAEEEINVIKTIS